MRRMLVLAATAALVLAASGGAALAAGQVLCSNGKSVEMPQPDGTCKNNQTALTLASEAEVTDLQSRVSALESDNTTLKSEVSTLQSEVSTLQSTLSKVSYDPSGPNGKPTLRITGANLQIVSGSGSTDGPVNGEGNLFIGYDEGGSSQTGSHNLVLGNLNNFMSYGGLVAGQGNVLAGPFEDVFGYGNEASGHLASVTGGHDNNAKGDFSSVTGGVNNEADGIYASVSGGQFNLSSGFASSILGGFDHTLGASFGTSP